MIENLNKYYFLTLIILIIFTGAFGIEEFIYFPILRFLKFLFYKVR